MAMLAVIELDCIKMDWKKNDNLLLVKIISICNKEIFGLQKPSKFNQRTAENFEDQIFEIKMCQLCKWRTVSLLIKSLKYRRN